MGYWFLMCYYLSFSARSLPTPKSWNTDTGQAFYVALPVLVGVGSVMVLSLQDEVLGLYTTGLVGGGLCVFRISFLR
jgi:hypothetical protein